MNNYYAPRYSAPIYGVILGVTAMAYADWLTGTHLHGRGGKSFAKSLFTWVTGSCVPFLVSKLKIASV